jgi:ribosomal-protein-alanine N-acetyltransferase
VRLVPYDAETAGRLPAAPGWPHTDTAAGLSFAASGAWTWLVLDDDGRIAGECGVKTLPDANGEVEIGYGLAAPSRGRGLGGRAVAALLDELRTRPDVRAVVAEVAVGNLASRRLLERLGFTVSGVIDGYVWYRRVV